jgi:hypothetical protein
VYGKEKGAGAMHVYLVDAMELPAASAFPSGGENAFNLYFSPSFGFIEDFVGEQGPAAYCMSANECAQGANVDSLKDTAACIAAIAKRVAFFHQRTGDDVLLENTFKKKPVGRVVCSSLCCCCVVCCVLCVVCCVVFFMLLLCCVLCVVCCV